MNYRTAILEDLSILLQFGEQLSLVEKNFDVTIAYDEEEARLRYTKQLFNPLALFLIAETQEKIPVGYLYAHISNEPPMQRGEIEVVFISEKYREAGIAQELISRSLAWMKDHKVKRVFSHIFAENQPSQRVFEKLGFAPHNIEYLLEIN